MGLKIEEINQYTSIGSVNNVFRKNEKIRFIFLGKTLYEDCLGLQRNIFQKKLNGELKENIFLITEHYPVYTTGKSTKGEHLPVINHNIPIINIERGGSITFHGENQIIIYPIINLKDFRLSVKKYIFLLEQIIIDTLREIGIEAYRKKSLVGVFTEKGKIGFIGVKISKFITMHGFSLNYNVNKRYFGNIIPCGLKDIPICNISDFTNVSKNEVISILKRNCIYQLL